MDKTKRSTPERTCTHVGGTHVSLQEGACGYVDRAACSPFFVYGAKYVSGSRFKTSACLYMSLAIAVVSVLHVPISEAADKLRFSGKVIGVTDGDTIKVLNNKKIEKIRLLDIDCPEKKQPFGQKSKQFASDLAFNKTVTVVYRKCDRYKRILGEVYLPDGRVLNHELLKAGLAWWYRRYSKDIKLEQMETDARQAKLGLWADPNPIPPWKWRKSKHGNIINR